MTIREMIEQLCKYDWDLDVDIHLATRYPRETIFRHIKQVKYDYCAGQRWGDPGAILVTRIQRGAETPNFGR